jgi:branched-chain amino acid transport system substrate-binding protein
VKRRFLGLVPIIAAITLVSACGSSGPSSTTSSSTGSSSTPGSSSTSSSSTSSTKLTGAPVLVGTIGSYSGANASSLGTTGQTAQAWADWVNNNGGVNGHPVKLFVIDDAGNPTLALQGAQTLVEQDHVIALVGENSSVDDAFASYLASKNIPVVGGVPLNTDAFTSPDFYPSGGNVITDLVGQFLVMQKLGLHRFGLLYCAEAPVCAQEGALADDVSKLIPAVKVVYTGEVAAAAPNYDATCLAMKSAKVDAYFTGAQSTTVVRVAEACPQFGFTAAPIDTMPGATLSWTSVPGLAGAQLISPNANWSDTSLPAVATFKAALDKYEPGVTSGGGFSVDDLFTWAGGMLFLAAAKAADIGPNSTSADVKKGLYMLKGETLGGIAPPLTFSQGKPTFVSCFFTAAISNGHFESLNGDRSTCIPPAIVAGLQKVLAG